MPKAEIIKRPIEQIGGDIKKSAWSAAIESLAILILGILFIAWPDTMVRVVSYVVGTIFIVKGSFQVITYFMEKGQNDFFNNNLLFGVISILIGITALVIGEDIANVFRIIVGIWMIYESLIRVNTAIKLSSAGISIWKYVMLLALVVMVLGIFVTFNDVTTVIGWMMIIAGLVGILGDIMFIQQINSLVEKITQKLS
ncbi:DUF308 domain-containing protein [Candidatus Saccharibacteria bacterium]|jgi:uncharacterized membrane protein HdeD (DUF308 family)|nr:DUF308 domain-containing protein [Candidatus Saccharibacteria bacterium]